MFTKLRLKLTLINASIILALFLLLAIGTYCFPVIDMEHRSRFVSRKIADDIRAGIIVDLPVHKAGPPPPGKASPAPWPGPPGPPPGPHFFFAKTSPAGVVTAASSSQPLDAEQLSKLTDKALAADSPRGRLKLGEAVYTYLRAPLENQQGSVVVFHDTAEERRMLRGLLTALTVVGLICVLLSFGASYFLARRAIVPIEKAWQQQKDFLSDASHELRTPLSVTQANLDIVLGCQEETVASQRKWLDNIREELKQMTTLVNSLLFLARADSQRQSQDRRRFSLTSALVRAVAPFGPVAAAKGVDLSSTTGPALTGFGDEAQIKQVLGILIDNALRHTPPGGRVSVRLAASGKNTVLEVADTGEGIAPEHLGKIFDRFYQVDKARHGGAGLGLSIAKWIVESHGGRICVKSQVGLGTAFSLEFPWRQPPANGDRQ